MRHQAAIFILIALCAFFTLINASGTFIKKSKSKQLVADKHHAIIKRHTRTTKRKSTKKTTTKSTTKKLSAASTNKIYGKHRLIAYVVDWDVPASIDWSKLDHVVYSFAEPSEKGELGSYTDSMLKSVVSLAHKNNVGVSISVGGWDGSKYFSTLVSSETQISNFVSNIMAMVDQFDLDGVNIDWEYPNDPNGVACNVKNAADTDNYLTFLQALRSALDAKYTNVHKLITLAVGTNPFNDENQQPTKTFDKAWSQAVDSFYIMTYDISGSWETQTGPNAPLNKASTSHYASSVEEAVQAWRSTGIPNDQLVVGLPFYGLTLKTSRAITSASGLYVKLANPSAIKGDQYDTLSADPCPGAKKSYSGEYEWRSIVSAGINDNENGWKTYWDNVSSTPYAFHSSGKIFLSYDDAQSLQSKIKYVNQEKLGGAMIWSLEMDDSKSTLLNSIQSVRDN